MAPELAAEGPGADRGRPGHLKLGEHGSRSAPIDQAAPLPSVLDLFAPVLMLPLIGTTLREVASPHSGKKQR